LPAVALAKEGAVLPLNYGPKKLLDTAINYFFYQISQFSHKAAFRFVVDIQLIIANFFDSSWISCGNARWV